MRLSYHGNTEGRKHGNRKHNTALFPFRASSIPCFRDLPSKLLLLALCASAAWSQVTVKKIDYEGWKDCWEISNPIVRLVVVPQIGGRIMEYSIQGENVFWQNEAELGKVTGSDVSFSVVRDMGGNSVTIKYSGKLADGTIKGKIDMDRGNGPTSRDWEAKLQK